MKKAKPDYLDMDKDDNKTEPMKQAIKQSKTSKKNTRKVKKKKVALQKESRDDIINFITAISQEKYATANKYLTKVIEDKVKIRIASNLNKPLF